MRCLAHVGTFAIGLTCGALGGFFLTQHPPGAATVEPGSEVIHLLDDEVMSVVLRTDRMTFTAQRSKPAARFAVQVTYAHDTPAQQCQASSNLAGYLATYTNITAKRQLPSQQQAEKDFPLQIGTLELRDRILDEQATTIRLRASLDRQALVALYDNVAVELANPASAFTELEDGCRLLSRPSAP